MDVKLKLSTEEHKDLVAYCNLNDLLISSVVKDSFTTGFNIERYGLLNVSGAKEKVVEKEVIVEKRVEIPVEVIKEIIKTEVVEIEKPVEVIKEVPVEKIVIKEVIKEVPVDKLVYITDQQELNEKIFQKEQDFQKERDYFSNRLKELENQPQKVIETIKEIVVEKVVEGDSKQKMESLQNTLMKLKQENDDKENKIKELEKKIEVLIQSEHQRGAVYFKGSNLDDKLYK